MVRIKAIIIDDEKLARVSLKKLIEPHWEIEIVGEVHSCQSAVEVIGQHKPQLIFLDVKLRGETGFDLLELIESSMQIIFVTAYNEYAVRAFEVNAIDYLLKPVSPERLSLALGKLVSQKHTQKRARKGYEYSDCIYVQLSNSTSKFVKICSITFIEPLGNYSQIATIEGKHYIVLKTLKQWEEELPDHNFIRIHRSYIINIEHVDHIERHSKTQYWVYIQQHNEPLVVSRRYASKLKSLG